MGNLIDSFVEKKKADSQFVSLEDGESIKVLHLMDIKIVNKLGFGGEEKEVLRLICEVETSEGTRVKTFDNGTQRFAKELQEKGIKIGSGFVLTRVGVQTKTRYTISQVVADNFGSAAPASPAASV